MSVAADLFFPRLADPDDGEAIALGERRLSYRELAAAAAAVGDALAAAERVAVWATTDLETCAAIVGSLAAGRTVVPINPSAGVRELEHIVADSRPDLLLARADAEVAEALRDLPRLDVRLEGAGAGDAGLPDLLADEDTAIILYTSGTTGLPKGVMIPRRAIVSNLDALAEIWSWTGADRLAHALPLFHVHGLVLGVLGPLRRGGRLELVKPFSPESIGQALSRGATMVFGVPTMYHRIARAAEADPALAASFASARLLVSGSAALPAIEHRRIEELTGQRIVERYGMTETLMNVGIRSSEERAPGYIGRPLPGVELRLLDDDGNPIEVADDETIGEIAIRGPNLFTGYLNRPDATEQAFRDGWFLTGDLATRRADGYVRIVGRRSVDLIKSGGYKIGAGEIEGALLEHPAVAEVAVAGLEDPDLGERIVAWVVPSPDEEVSADELVAHVATLLSAHKRPREIHFVDALPRNAMGKVMKNALKSGVAA
ncbi:MAG TPA: acyl-CoA synthetase [Gaiellaceae bacterium]|jgi:malonyl-CoA/methylmalonyl-CoA synthetase